VIHDSIAPLASQPQNLFSAMDVAAILRDRGWLPETTLIASSENDGADPLEAWLARTAQLLGPHAINTNALADLLSLIFSYDANALLGDAATHALLSRPGAREVIRATAHQVLGAEEIDSDRFKAIITALKADLPYRGPALFRTIRLALAGRIGEGELDRVILLLDPASKLDFQIPVKSCRHRILEFCAALD
jgi:hypothetical protein